MRNIRPNEKADHFKDINRIGGFYDEKHSPHKDSLLTRSSGPVQAHDLAYEINLETAVHVEKKLFTVVLLPPILGTSCWKHFPVHGI